MDELEVSKKVGAHLWYWGKNLHINDVNIFLIQRWQHQKYVAKFFQWEGAMAEIFSIGTSQDSEHETG